MDGSQEPPDTGWPYRGSREGGRKEGRKEGEEEEEEEEENCTISTQNGGEYRIDRKHVISQRILIRLASKFQGMRICKVEGARRQI